MIEIFGIDGYIICERSVSSPLTNKFGSKIFDPNLFVNKYYLFTNIISREVKHCILLDYSLN